jgi:hypothetical protein
MTTSSGSPRVGKSVDRVVIEKPDRILISGGPNVVAIGSTGYFKVQPGWTVVRHVGESTNFTNDMLMFLHILDRTTTVVRRGDTYVVPTEEASRLLVSTRSSQFQNPVGVALSATVQAGLLKSMTLRIDSGSPLTVVTTTVSRVGTSPNVNAPPQSQIVPGGR